MPEPGAPNWKFRLAPTNSTREQEPTTSSHQPRLFFLFSVLLLGVLLGAGCAAVNPETAPLVLRPSSFSALPGWDDDRHEEALAAFRRSCASIMELPPGQPSGPDPRMGAAADWQAPCQALPASAAATPSDARAFFEGWFAPWQATMAGKQDEGLFTGYYEPSLRGSLTRQGPYQYPLRLRPSDLVTVDLGEFRPGLKGQRVTGRVVGGQLKPYEDRAAINRGALPGDSRLDFVWVDSPVDAFFLQIQGSGRIALEGGAVLRVGYDGQNGWPYYAIGRELIRRGYLTKDQVSMQSIRAWLNAHPDQADEIMNTDKSYVFFKVLQGDGPLGAEGVALTPGRSLAVDRARIPYGAPVWIATAPPVPGEPPLHRLMVAQDTGDAIRGAVRGDVFWGYGARAEDLAGKMKASGRAWLLLPKARK
jgi:membrane-bound lytic murein transglycosylase A